MLLAGDVGGTKTALAVFSAERGPRQPLAKATFSSGRYPSFEAVALEFMQSVRVPVDRAAVGVAGPVVDGRVTGTNLPWDLDEIELQESLKLRSVRLLNDLEAIANAVPILSKDDVATLSAGQPEAQGAMAVVAPGTGLGEAFLVWDGSRYLACPSEGGHTDFGPNSSLQVGLLRYLQERFGHVSYERVCSGMGLPNIYAYLRDSCHVEEPPWLAERLSAASDPTPIIVSAALDEASPCQICAVTLDAFVAILGAEAGNLALRVLATGGVYLGGGIPPRILPALRGARFLRAFQGKGRLSYVVASMPVHVILNPEAGLLGAARYGLSS